jgi:serine protease Do
MMKNSKEKQNIIKVIIGLTIACGLFFTSLDFSDASPRIVINKAHAKAAPTSFADLSEKVVPSVVNISTTQIIPGGGDPMGQLPGFGLNDRFFKEFFGDNFPGMSGQARDKEAKSLGSGFIIDKSGLIVTNNHVIGDADEIEVVLYDGTREEAEVVGRDEKIDIALIKINTKKTLQAVSFGDSDNVRVGDWVLAVGNPFGLGNTVTAGIISARARNINAGPYDDFFQTDASINRGNSGGPMFNMDGEVIGINTAIFSPSGGSVGIGFAVPSNLAKWVFDDLKEYGRARRSWLGVKIQQVTDEIADSVGLEQAKGVLVLGVSDGSPADKVGVQPGDVILAFDGKKIMDIHNLPRMVAATGIGKQVKVKIFRDGEVKNLLITLAELEEEGTSYPAKPRLNDTKSTADELYIEKVDELAMEFTKLTPVIRKKLGISKDIDGLVVVAIDKGSNAENQGIRKGMVVIEANQSAIKSVADLKEQVQKAKSEGKKSILLLVETSKGLRFVAVKLK